MGSFQAPYLGVFLSVFYYCKLGITPIQFLTSAFHLQQSIISANYYRTRQLGIFYSLLNFRNSTNKAITNIHSTTKSVIATENAENIHPTISAVIGMTIEKTR